MIATLTTWPVPTEPLNPPALDEPGVLARVKGDLTFLHVVFEAFRTQYPEQRSEMRKAIAAGDLTSVGTLAHSLKGNASTLGGQRVAAVAADMVATCRVMDAGPLAELLRRLDQEVSYFQKAMIQLLANSK